MISVKEAVEKAIEFAQALGAPGEEYHWRHSMRLEEVDQDMAKGTRVWQITLSIPKGSSGILNTDDRLYRIFAVDKESGEVLSMKIREFSGTHV